MGPTPCPLIDASDILYYADSPSALGLYGAELQMLTKALGEVVGANRTRYLTDYRAKSLKPAFVSRIFTKANGSPLHPDETSKQFNRLVAASGLPRIRFHDLRHTWATMALEAGIPAKIVSVQWICEDRLTCLIGQLERIVAEKREGIRLAYEDIESSRGFINDYVSMIDKARRELHHRELTAAPADEKPNARRLQS
ncbi:MAG: tyrosine-type recombinase/integrase [Acidimicrobiia bacterium]